jgi:hypothetical protein
MALCCFFTCRELWALLHFVAPNTFNNLDLFERWFKGVDWMQLKQGTVVAGCGWRVAVLAHCDLSYKEETMRRSQPRRRSWSTSCKSLSGRFYFVDGSTTSTSSFLPSES